MRASLSGRHTYLNSPIKKIRFTARALVWAWMAPQFSIVTPSFLQPQYLRLCSASVLDQADVTVEHLVQEGGGVGGLDGWCPCDPRVHLCVEPDSGMYDAVNRGFSKARGLILGHLNADEQYLPGALSTVWRVFEDNPNLDVIFGDVVLLNSQWIPVSYRRVILPNKLHTKRVHLGTMTCSAFFRRRLLERNLYYPTEWKTIGDAVLVLKWLKSGVTMRTIHRPLAAFVFTGANLGNSATAIEEGRRFAGQHKTNYWVGLAAQAQHRIRKLAAGAYLRRGVNIQIYLPDHHSNRMVLTAKSVGFTWPRQ
jgi:glycosyltransferase involved in cell wall biosynthesis